MPDIGKIHHTIRSKVISLKDAVELLQKYPAGKQHKVITLMRETAQDIARLLTELETELRNTGQS